MLINLEVVDFINISVTRHSRSNTYQRRGIIIDRVFIDKHPKIVEKKSRIGDFEIDTVIGKYHIGALVTIVDRKSKFTLIQKVKSKRAKEVTKAPIQMLITFDNVVLSI